MTPEEELFEVRYNNWMYHLWTDFVTPPDSWCPLDLNMARTPGIRSAHITKMLTKLHQITWCPSFPKIKSSTITFLLIKIRVVVRKGLCGKNSQVADPLPPVWEFSHFFTVFLPFYKPLNWKKQRKIWSGFGSDPSPQFGNFSHIIPFFFWQRP